MENLKKQLFDQCVAYVNQRIANANDAVIDSQSSANAETKSTAGDKHDTARAMMQLAAEQNAKHLAEATKLKQVLQLINPDNKHTIAKLGSAVKTSNGNFYIAISAGKIEIEKELFYAISPTSPIGQLLTGLTVGETAKFNGREITLLELY